MSVSRISDTDDTSIVLAIVRGKFHDWEVDWRLRNQEGTFQNACDYYHDGELIHTGDWFRLEFVDIDESGENVQFSAPHGGGEMPFEDWVDTAAVGYLEDELSDIWNDVKEMYDEK